MNVDLAANIAQILSVAGGFLLAVLGILKRLEKKDQESKIDIEIMKEKLEFIQTQFGPNGGGLRQAVNEISHKVDSIEKRVYDISHDVAKLSGEFHQHIVENDTNH